MGAAVVGAAEEIERLLLRHLDDQDRRPHLGRMRLDAVLEFQSRQIAGEQQVALDGADIDRALG